MARIRSVKPEFWTDRSLARKLSRDARMLYLGLWNLADEHARLNGDAYYIKGQIFPYDDDLTPGRINGLLDEIDAAGKVVRYAANGDPYLFLPTLHRHQRLEADKVPSRMPEPPEPASLRVNEDAYVQVEAPAQIRADLSARDADLSEPDADSSTLLYVAGSMEHGAWSMEHVPPRAVLREPARAALAEPLPLAPLADPELTFEDFWKPWPRKVDKEPARKAFDKASRKASPAVIVAACRAYAERCREVGQDPSFIPHATTWLNRESWSNDLDAVMPLASARASPPNNGYQPYRNPTDPDAYKGDL